MASSPSPRRQPRAAARARRQLAVAAVAAQAQSSPTRVLSLWPVAAVAATTWLVAPLDHQAALPLPAQTTALPLSAAAAARRWPAAQQARARTMQRVTPQAWALCATVAQGQLLARTRLSFKAASAGARVASPMPSRPRAAAAVGAGTAAVAARRVARAISARAAVEVRHGLTKPGPLPCSAPSRTLAVARRVPQARQAP